MSTPSNPPELIISLSRDTVRLQLLEHPESGRAYWQSSFPIQGAFLEDQISNALDTALFQNPSLFDPFEQVEIVIIDRPNVCIPQYYLESGQLPQIAGKYLRLSVGDTISTDSNSTDTVIAYTLPSATLHVLREYYSNVSHLHMVSVLWSTLINRDVVFSNQHSRLYFNITGNTLIVLGECDGKLTFSRNFTIHDQGDLMYYSIACSRLLHPREIWHVTIRNESPEFELPQIPHFRFHHHLELPELPTLITQHRLCAS